jgi:TolB-like protein/cytochrome c-type biogenesis protein CcmH/NrfG
MPDVPPSVPHRAVFLSYAREDSEATRRIADALRAFGLEVWFDQNELRGGDSWDQKIRRQIRECALFIPVISATTQERGEGYFRREWKLGVERTHDMSAGVAFIMPVVIDETPEKEAEVPEEFMRYQWTRLPHGVPSSQFVEQVKSLLDAPRKSATRTRAATPVAESTSGDFRAPKKSGGRGLLWGVGAVLVAVAAVAAFVLLRKPAPPATPAAAGVKLTGLAGTDLPVDQVKKEDKSIAVLPFTNMSEDKDNAFFADGVHEDVLTNLALIRDLRVVSRTSVMPYRTTTKSIRQIAQELGVTYILEGSVRRSGNKVRVTGQLIHAATDEHVWAEAYDRDLSDVFAIQAELSKQIAGALKTALSPEEKMLIASKPTNNPEAYDLLLHAREVDNREGNTVTALQSREALLLKAVELDPAYADAWGQLAIVEALYSFWNHDQSEERKARAKEAIDRAVRLSPNSPDVIESLGTYLYYGHRDYAGAIAQYEALARLQPNAPGVAISLGLIQRRQGRWPEALVNLRRATQLDPGNTNYARIFAEVLLWARRYDEYLVAQRRVAELQPEKFQEGFAVAEASFFARGSTAEADGFIAHLTPEIANSPLGLQMRKVWARDKGDLAEAIRLDRLQPYFDEDGDDHYYQAHFAAETLLAAGNLAGARARAGDFPAEVRAKLEREPENQWLLTHLAGFEVILGHAEEAQRLAERAVAQLPESRDAVDGMINRYVLARTYAWTGAKDKALAELARMARTPNQVFNVHSLNAGHWFAPIENDPRFQALLADPASNAPLF